MNIQDLLKKNRTLKNLHAGKRCFIVGNGPSVKTQNLTLLKDEITIVASSFFRHPDAKVIHPEYWILADPSFWEKPEELFWPTLNLAVEKNVDVKLFVPTGGAPFFVKVNTGPLIDLHFYHYDNTRNIQSVIDFAAGIPPFGQNVIIICMMLAYYLGCNPIYCVGCDHDFLKLTKDDFDSSLPEHFYHNPDQKKYSEVLTWEQWQVAMARTTYQYDQLKQYAELWGFNVYNATTGGHFNVFPRVEYESLFLRPAGLPGNLGHGAGEADAMGLARCAAKLLNDGAADSALELLEVGLRRNLNTRNKVHGVEYLMALCLARLNRYGEALRFARQDRECNPPNYENAGVLIRQLEDACTVLSLTGSVKPYEIHHLKG